MLHYAKRTYHYVVIVKCWHLNACDFPSCVLYDNVHLNDLNRQYRNFPFTDLTTER